MKIGIFDPYLDTLSGGEKYILTAAECLAAAHQVSIFWPKEEESLIKARTLEKFGIDLKSVSFSKNIFAKDVSLPLRLLSSLRYDYILFLTDGSIPFVLCNLMIHFQFPVEWLKKDFKMKLKFLKIKKVICNSYFTKSYVDKKFNLDSLVLYPPVSIYSKSLQKKNVILHVGRFGIDKEGSNYKKQDVMIDVFKELCKEGLKDWSLVFVISLKESDKQKFLKLKERAKGFPIVFIENPKNQEVKQAYEEAKIYWHATGFGEDLRKYPERAEHFGISTVEAMSAGAVPVVIKAGGQLEIVEDGVNGYLWDTKDKLIAKTRILTEDRKIWEKLSYSSVERAKKFNTARFCKELTAIFGKK